MIGVYILAGVILLGPMLQSAVWMMIGFFNRSAGRRSAQGFQSKRRDAWMDEHFVRLVERYNGLSAEQ